jgi:Immunoglobulin-like domain of bacterial spore germination
MRAALLGCLLLAACGSLGVPPPTPSGGRTTSAAATPSPTPSPAFTVLSSVKGGITLSRPQPNARITSGVTIAGDASVFEAALQWRIADSAGRVFAQGNTTASAGAPGRGTYSITANFTPPATDTIAIVEVWSVSAKDGTIDEIVRVPVVVTR